MSELRGTLTGTSRKDITRQAQEIAETYYDTQCINITLNHETAVTEYAHENIFQPATATGTTFTADYTAEIQHRVEHPAYGFPKCITCKTEFY